MTVLNPYAGPGGWERGARSIGIDPIGIELDPDACATRAAAGLRTIRADLSRFGPNSLHLNSIEGLIASPPCQAFSAAGTRNGRPHIPNLAQVLDQTPTDNTASHLDQLVSSIEATSPAVAHLIRPLQWITALNPVWVAFEQVPSVLPFWEAVARWLERRGYSAWAGTLCAADYGVPQTRTRAILIAHRHQVVQPPVPTHARAPHGRLFGEPEQPWVTMAQALNLDDSLIVDTGWVFERPATTVVGDCRVWAPGHRLNADDEARLGTVEAAARYQDRAGSDAIRLTPAQLGVLQTFPADYPWQGTKTSQAQQVGNAIPPLLAQRILEFTTTFTPLAPNQQNRTS